MKLGFPVICSVSQHVIYSVNAVSGLQLCVITYMCQLSSEPMHTLNGYVIKGSLGGKKTSHSEQV